MTRERGIALILAMGSMLIPLNSTMLVVALPRMLDHFDAPLSAGGWMVTTYLIAMASLQPVTGKIGDRFGPRRVLLAGLAGFMVASVGAALAPTVEALIAFRVAQGVTGAMVMPNASGLVRRVVPPEMMGRAMGMVGATIMAGAALGPVLGGLLLGAGGWRATFAVNVPIILVVGALVVRFVPDVAPARAGGRFDLWGSAGLLVLLGAASWLMVEGENVARAVVVGGGAALLVLAVAFVRYEGRHADPVVRGDLFRTRAFVGGAGATATGNLSMYVTLLVVPVLLHATSDWSDSAIGVVLAALPLASLAVAPIGGRLADTIGSRTPAVVGQAMALAALVWLAAGARGAGLVGAMLLIGFGLGIANPALQAAALSAVDPDESGAASGVLSTCRYAGSITGTSLLAGPLAPHGSTGFRAVFVMCAVGAAAATAFVTLLPGRPRPHPDPDPQLADAVA